MKERKLDVLFVNPNIAKDIYQELSEQYTAIEPPTWSLLLAEACRSAGFGCAILDCDAERLTDEQSVERIKELNPRLVCYVTYGGNPNSGTTNMVGIVKLGELLWQTYPEYKTCSIGSHTSALPLEVLGCPYIDFVCINDGVRTLKVLLNTDLKTDLNNIKGLGYKNGGRVYGELKLNDGLGTIIPSELMDIEMPGYAIDLLPYKNKPLDLYRSHVWHANFIEEDRTPFFSLYTSLGCYAQCNFCMINLINRTDINPNITAQNSNIMRFWSIDWITKQLKKLNDLGVNTIRFADELMIYKPKHYVPIFESIKNLGLKVNSWVYARVNTVKEQFLDLIREGGVRYVAYGIEAADQKVRQEITKGFFKDVDIREIVCKTREHGINVISNFIVGLPTDTLETMQKTLDMALELNTEYFNIYPCMALPGSPLYLEAIQQGQQLPKRFSEWSFLSYDSLPMRTETLTNADVLRFRDEAWNKCATNPAFLGQTKQRFGQKAYDNVVAMSKIKLKRRLLGD